MSPYGSTVYQVQAGSWPSSHYAGGRPAEMTRRQRRRMIRRAQRRAARR